MSQRIDCTGNRYCGPLVLAGVLGTSTAQAAALVRRHTGVRYVKGLLFDRLKATLAGEGVDVYEWPVPRNEVAYFGRKKLRGPTFATWLRYCRTLAATRKTFIILLTGHYVVIKGNLFADTKTKGEWVPIHQAPHRRCRVVRVLEIITGAAA